MDDIREKIMGRGPWGGPCGPAGEGEQPGARWQQHGGHGGRGGPDGPGSPGRRGRGGPDWGAWGGGFGRSFGGFGPGGPGGAAGGPPPWLAGLFGMGEPEQRRGPRVRRGDVRSAILDVLAEAGRRDEPVNGYQVIQQIGLRSRDAWRPSPGSVYPTIQQLEDEGLVESDDERGRKTLRLTAEGQTWVADHADELAAVWAPFEDSRTPEAPGRHGRVDLKPEIGQVMGAVWQIVSSGSEDQRRAATEILVDARRKLYGVLADGPEGATDGETAAEEDGPR